MRNLQPENVCATHILNDILYLYRAKVLKNATRFITVALIAYCYRFIKLIEAFLENKEIEDCFISSSRQDMHIIYETHCLDFDFSHFIAICKRRFCICFIYIVFILIIFLQLMNLLKIIKM